MNLLDDSSWAGWPQAGFEKATFFATWWLANVQGRFATGTDLQRVADRNHPVARAEFRPGQRIRELGPGGGMPALHGRRDTCRYNADVGSRWLRAAVS
jgi:hypothetical protein